MNVSINWLKEYVNIKKFSVKEIADSLTLAGLETEGFIELKPLNNIVTAKVISKEKHPNADKLSVCKVFDGKNEYQVVCGASNVDKGLIIPFAKIGAVLGDLTIKEAKLRGIESFGMICSEKELGIAKESSGIMILPSNTKLGQDINKVIGLDDTVLELNVTPNRPDWLSIIGVAREVSAVLKTKLHTKDYKLKESKNKIEDLININVLDKEACPIYQVRIIKGVKAAPSPLWMQARLRSAGIRPKNNIVDVTNYILMEYGQPLHAFDYDKLGNNINVRMAKMDETIKALDGKEYKLANDVLVIADNKKPVAIAGVMGGEDTAVSDETCNIVLECAYFNPSSIRMSSKKLGISSDSSYRFERGIDYGKTLELIDYAAYMISNICGGEVLKGTACVKSKQFKKRTIVSSCKDINKLLGTNFSSKDISSSLNRLGIKTEVNKDELKSIIPTHRDDIYRTVDIAEEAARIIGYDKIGCSTPFIDKSINIQNPKVRYTRKIRHILETLGFNEVVNFSFMASDYQELFDNKDNFVKLLNPISTDMAWMRTFIFPSIIKNMQLNRNLGFQSIKLFEISSIYKSKGKSCLAEEKTHISIGVMGDYYNSSWHDIGKIDTFFYLKGIVENIFNTFGLKGEYVRLEDCPFMHPGKSAKISVNGKYIGFIGKIHPEYEEKIDIKSPCYISELDFSLLVNEGYNVLEKEKSSMKYKKISRFPYIERDFALIVKNNICASDIINLIKNTHDLITDVWIFDVFEGKPINFGYKSIAVRVNFSDVEKTLRDDDINPIVEKILKELEQNYGAVLR